jgi:hypothetical protein
MDDLAWRSDAELARMRLELASELAAGARFAPGSLHEEWRKCGKAGCHCAAPGDPGHGPRNVLVRREGGRVRTVQVPASMVGAVEAGVGRWQRFEAVRARLVAVNAEEVRRELLAAPPGARSRGRGPGPGRAGEKGGP